MATRQDQKLGTATTSKISQTSLRAPADCAESAETEHLQDRLREYREILRAIQERVLEEAFEAVDHYGFDKCRVLEGDDLGEALRRYDGVSLIQERVIDLQKIEPIIDRALAILPDDADARSLERELHFLQAPLVLNGFSLLRCLRDTAFAMGLDPTPFTIVQENLTTESRAKALGLAELMSLELRRTTTPEDSIHKNDLGPNDEPALTKNQQTVLKTISRVYSSFLLSTSDIKMEMDLDKRLSEETIRLVIRDLVQVRLVERPHGPRKGCRLTLLGRRVASKIAD